MGKLFSFSIGDAPTGSVALVKFFMTIHSYGLQPVPVTSTGSAYLGLGVGSSTFNLHFQTLERQVPAKNYPSTASRNEVLPEITKVRHRWIFWSQLFALLVGNKATSHRALMTSHKLGSFFEVVTI